MWPGTTYTVQATTPLTCAPILTALRASPISRTPPGRGVRRLTCLGPQCRRGLPPESTLHQNPGDSSPPERNRTTTLGGGATSALRVRGNGWDREPTTISHSAHGLRSQHGTGEQAERTPRSVRAPAARLSAAARRHVRLGQSPTRRSTPGRESRLSGLGVSSSSGDGRFHRQQERVVYEEQANKLASPRNRPSTPGP